LGFYQQRGLATKQLDEGALKFDKLTRLATLPIASDCIFVEKIEDRAAPSQERAQRKRKLTKGPSEFREDRIDQPKEYCPVAQADGAEAGNNNPSLVRDWQAQ
jgi:hypothetical protein